MGGARAPQPISQCRLGCNPRPQPFPPGFLLSHCLGSPWHGGSWPSARGCLTLCPPCALPVLGVPSRGDEGRYFVGCRCSQLFSKRKEGSFGSKVASSCPLGLGWEPPGAGSRGYPGSLGGCGGEGLWAGGRRALENSWQGWEELGWSAVVPRWCRGAEELSAPALPSLPAVVPPSVHPFWAVLPAQDVPASLSLALCQPFPTLPNPGLQPCQQLLKSPRAGETGPGP